MRLIKLFLENFRGIKSLTIDFNGDDTVIYGANGTGKTTVANAISYVLSGKSATGEKDFSPKTVGVHNVHHVAELTVCKDDGEVVVLKKEFYEKWTKKRGSQSPTFTGHVCELSINDLPVKTKEYDKVISELTNGHVDDIEFLTVMGHMVEKMNDNERRKVLFSLCGEVTDDDILAKPEFDELSKLLVIEGTKDQRYEIPDFKKKCESKRRELNKKLDSIPESIATLESAMAGEYEDEADVKARLAENRAKLQKLLAPADAVNGNEEIIRDVKEKIAEGRQKFGESKYKALSAFSETEQTMMNDVAKYETSLNRAKTEQKWLEAEIERKTKVREELLGEFEVKVKAMVWDENSTICPTCGQKMPEDKINELFSKFSAEREANKAYINAKGKANGVELEKHKETLKATVADIEMLEAVLKKQNEALAKWRESKPVDTPYEETDEYKELKKTLDELEAGTASVAFNPTDKADYEKLIEEDEQKLVDIGAKAKMDEKIAELKASVKTVSAELEKQEKAIYLCEQFMIAKAEMITANINDKFSCIKWKLFETQINGGLREVCVPMIPNADGVMVDYKMANTASQINANLEIMDVYAKAYGVNLPIIIDRAESITNIRDMDCQTVSLVVSADDKVLRIEKAVKENEKNEE
ncbi:AAA family ATPase [Anaerovibrio sp. RM50]|uniref:AAA family ATPase n=1 Tax=Anaerovibrio sp. RM50 TaxID=1200557 RepID=UPI00048215B0|nr:AAA family ATPase [Anaerovibrio sp. RM50]